MSRVLYDRHLSTQRVPGPTWLLTAARPVARDDDLMTVVGLGAWCDVQTDGDVADPAEGFGRVLHFRVQEFAAFADGRRVTLHDERGFSMGSSTSEDLWTLVTLEGLERDVRTTVLPDEEDTEDEHPYEWLADLLRVHGVDVVPGQLRGLPYVVEFSQRLRARVAR